MCTVGARLSVIAAAILILSFASRPAFARGSPVGYDPVWSSERIARLPPEVRNAVTHMCADPRAGDYFATYLDNSHLIELHFEHLQCDRKGAFCRAGGCLQQEYISIGGRYRLVRSYYRRNN
jgi:hypothetical protein